MTFFFFISSCRTGNWSSLENVIKYLFARDLLNYARLMPVHLAQMNALETEDPETWSALKSGRLLLLNQRHLSLICSLTKPLSRE